MNRSDFFESQVVEYMSAIVIYRERNLTLELSNNWNTGDLCLVLSDGYNTDFITALDDTGKFCCNGTFLLSEEMRLKIQEVISKGIVK